MTRHCLSLPLVAALVFAVSAVSQVQTHLTGQDFRDAIQQVWNGQDGALPFLKQYKVQFALSGIEQTESVEIYTPYRHAVENVLHARNLNHIYDESTAAEGIDQKHPRIEVFVHLILPLNKAQINSAVQFGRMYRVEVSYRQIRGSREIALAPFVRDTALYGPGDDSPAVGATLDFSLPLPSDQEESAQPVPPADPSGVLTLKVFEPTGVTRVATFNLARLR